MKKMTLFLVLFLSIPALKAGVINCEIRDLATADVLSSHKIDNLKIEDLQSGLNFTLTNDYAQSVFDIRRKGDQILHFQISSVSDVEEVVVTHVIAEERLAKKMMLGASSVMSQALNLDTLYSFCHWIP